MTAEALITDLTARGAVLTLAGDDIRVEAPMGELTPADVDQLQSHKQDLIKLLTVPSRWDEYQDALVHAFANPSTRADIGPLWMTDPVGFGSIESRSPGGLCSSPRPANRLPGVCGRCGSDQHKDFSHPRRPGLFGEIVPSVVDLSHSSYGIRPGRASRNDRSTKPYHFSTGPFPADRDRKNRPGSRYLPAVSATVRRPSRRCCRLKPRLTTGAQIAAKAAKNTP